MLRGHVIGAFVRALRVKRLSGAAVHELVEMLGGHGIELSEAAEYIGDAFLVTRPKVFTLLNWDQATKLPPSPDVMERRVGRLIDEKRPSWETSPFPELMRLRDYFSFLE